LSRPSLTPWVYLSLIVTVFVTINSPFVLLPAWSCCGRTDATIDLFLAPARPFIQVISAWDLNPLLALPAIGLSYGLLVLAVGAVITGLRRAWRP